jgi:hypothetical protein
MLWESTMQGKPVGRSIFTLSLLSLMLTVLFCASGAALTVTSSPPARDATTLEDAAEGFVPPRAEQVRFASLVRGMIDSLCARTDCTDPIALLKREALQRATGVDSSLGRQLLTKLDGDSGFVKQCLRVADERRNWHSAHSRHFVFYFQGDTAPAAAAMQAWDEHFERLSATFGTTITGRVPFAISDREPYGRCFPPWDVRWGIEQSEVGDNPHELVHLMLFQYSDVPFFHEPLAFIYGTHAGDLAAAAERAQRYERVIADSGYVSSAEILHFPQIIGLGEAKWASSFYFVYKLVTKYDVEKLLRLMRMTPWDGSADDFAEAFGEIYGMDLVEFERSIVQDLR